jgi:hypothetical protein
VLLLDTSVIKKGSDSLAKGCPHLLQKWAIAVVIPCENGSTLVFFIMGYPGNEAIFHKVALCVLRVSVQHCVC